MDSKSLLRVNNMSVFVNGLVDHSSMGKAMPIVVSMPHFINADPSLKKDFPTKPDVSKHLTSVGFICLSCIWTQVQC